MKNDLKLNTQKKQCKNETFAAGGPGKNSENTTGNVKKNINFCFYYFARLIEWTKVHNYFELNNCVLRVLLLEV